MAIQFKQYDCPVKKEQVEVKLVDNCLVYINCGRFSAYNSAHCLMYSRNPADSKSCHVQEKIEKRLKEHSEEKSIASRFF